MSTITTIEVVDTHESYGMWGKVVAKSDVFGMTDVEILREGDEMLEMFPGHSLRYVEEVSAA